MAWVTPKTDWQRKDRLEREPDYARLCGNLSALYEKGTLLYGFEGVRVPRFADVAENAWATPEFFNAIEDATAQLVFYLGLLPQYLPRSLMPGQPVWSPEDLNRLERTMQFLYTALHAAQNAAPMLQFTLGGDAIG